MIQLYSHGQPSGGQVSYAIHACVGADPDIFSSHRAASKGTQPVSRTIDTTPKAERDEFYSTVTQGTGAGISGSWSWLRGHVDWVFTLLWAKSTQHARLT